MILALNWFVTSLYVSIISSCYYGEQSPTIWWESFFHYALTLC